MKFRERGNFVGSGNSFFLGDEEENNTSIRGRFGRFPAGLCCRLVWGTFEHGGVKVDLANLG